MTFDSFELNPALSKAVKDGGYELPTDIQRLAIPIVMAGKDLMASAQTGTGKTAAFVLPMLHRLMAKPGTGRRGPRALVLAPTRELAEQVLNEARRFGKHSGLSFGLVVGGVGYGPQYQLLSRPLDLLVATPGRLIDHLEQKRVDLSNVEFLVLDEADRMLDMGFVKPVRQIASYIPEKRQGLLFSATLEGAVKKVATELLNHPEQIELAANKVKHEGIDQRMFHVDSVDHKRRLLDHWLGDPTLQQAVIFTGTKRRADRLCKALQQDGHACAALHGDKSHGVRKRTVDQMRKGEVRLLIATDVAARGLDIDGISHVINFDLPMVPEDYIHRIGRTGRAGTSGVSVTLVAPEDREKLRDIEKLTGNRLTCSVLEGDEPKLSPNSYVPPAPPRGQGGRGGQGGRPQGGGGRPQGGGGRSGPARSSGGGGGRSFRG